MGLNCTNTVNVSDIITETLSVIGGVNATTQQQVGPIYQFVNGSSTGGTVASTVDEHWELSGVNAVTLASSATVTYTLSALTDVAGRTIALARARKVLIWITSRSDGDYLSVGAATVHPWTAWISSGTVTVPVFDSLTMVAANKVGLVVNAGVSDQLKITNSGSNPITFGINISGCSS